MGGGWVTSPPERRLSIARSARISPTSFEGDACSPIDRPPRSCLLPNDSGERIVEGQSNPEVTMRSARTLAVLIVLTSAALAYHPARGQSPQQQGTAAAGRLALSTSSAAAKMEFWTGLEDWQSFSFSSAERHFRRALALDDRFALARLFATGEYAITRQEAADRDRGVAEAARQSPEEGVLALFWREKALGNRAKERALLRAAMQLMPNEPSILAEYLWASMDESIDQKQLLDTARAFHARFPSYAPLLLPIPVLSMTTGDTAGALRAAEEYTRLAPRSPTSFGYYGGLLQQLGRFDAAEAQFRKGMTLLPAHAEYGNDAASALAELYAWRGRYADARTVATEALGRITEPSDSAMYMTEIAATYFATGDATQGMKLLEMARQKSAVMGNANGPERLDAILAQANAVFGDGHSVSGYVARLRPEMPVDSAIIFIISARAFAYGGQLDSALAYVDRLAGTSVPWREVWAHRIRGVAFANAKQCSQA